MLTGTGAKVAEVITAFYNLAVFSTTNNVFPKSLNLCNARSNLVSHGCKPIVGSSTHKALA